MYESLIYVVIWLVRHGYAKDIIEALNGESGYSCLVEYKKLDRHSLHLRGMAIRHLEYLIENKNIDLSVYPNVNFQNIKTDNKILSSNHDYFNAWNLAGFPGMSIDQLNRLALDRGYEDKIVPYPESEEN